MDTFMADVISSCELQLYSFLFSKRAAGDPKYDQTQVSGTNNAVSISRVGRPQNTGQSLEEKDEIYDVKKRSDFGTTILVDNWLASSRLDSILVSRLRIDCRDIHVTGANSLASN
jgi:hypothetical protein